VLPASVADRSGNGRCLLLGWSVDWPHGQRPALCSATLLYDVREFVRQHLLSVVWLRARRFLTQEDVATEREGTRVQRAIERVGLIVGVDAHILKAMAKACLHARAGCAIERRPAALLLLNATREVGMYVAARGIDLRLGWSDRDAGEVEPRLGSTPGGRWIAYGMCQLVRKQPSTLFGFGLFGNRPQQPLHRLIAKRALQGKDRSLRKALPRVAQARFRRLGGWSLLRCFRFLCERAHGQTPFGLMTCA
jgi:hypothetical protein